MGYINFIIFSAAPSFLSFKDLVFPMSFTWDRIFTTELTIMGLPFQQSSTELLRVGS